MAHILFKFIIYPSFERALKHGIVKSKVFRKSSLNFSYGQGIYLISGFAWPNSIKAVLLIFNNIFGFCLAGFLRLLMISFCGMPRVAG